MRQYELQISETLQRLLLHTVTGNCVSPPSCIYFTPIADTKLLHLSKPITGQFLVISGWKEDTFDFFKTSHNKGIKPVCIRIRHQHTRLDLKLKSVHPGATFALNWSRVCVRLMNVSPIFTLLLTLFRSLPTAENSCLLWPKMTIWQWWKWTRTGKRWAVKVNVKLCKNAPCFSGLNLTTCWM